MSVRELTLWAAFDRINPISDKRGDIHAAQITSAIMQSVGCKNVTLSDFLIDWGKDNEDDENLSEPTPKTTSTNDIGIAAAEKFFEALL